METSPPAAASIRPGRDEDAAGLIALIGACWAEYPGCCTDVEGEAPEMRALASYYADAGGHLWTAERCGAVVGVAAVRPCPAEGTWEICRVYVARALRGTGLAHALLDRAEAWARQGGATRLVMYSDTRFDRAHRFYEKRGFVRQGAIRALDDRSDMLEYRYAKPCAGIAVERLDAAGAASAVNPLAEILVACVDGGAAVSFLPPLALETARAFWRGVATGVAEGHRVLLAGWYDGVLAGTVQIVLDTPPNQPHRADLAKLLVHPAARRAGLARALMRAADAAAVASGRTLLTLDTRAGDAAESLYRALDWHEAGRIPGYARNADGTSHDTVLFWRCPPPPRTAAAGGA